MNHQITSSAAPQKLVIIQVIIQDDAREESCGVLGTDALWDWRVGFGPGRCVVGRGRVGGALGSGRGPPRNGVGDRQSWFGRRAI